MLRWQGQGWSTTLKKWQLNSRKQLEFQIAEGIERQLVWRHRSSAFENNVKLHSFHLRMGYHRARGAQFENNVKLHSFHLRMGYHRARGAQFENNVKLHSFHLRMGYHRARGAQLPDFSQGEGYEKLVFPPGEILATINVLPNWRWRQDCLWENPRQ